MDSSKKDSGDVDNVRLNNICLEDSSVSYFYKFNANVKARWIGKELLEFFSEEFIHRSREYYQNAICLGTILVNNERSNVNYKIKQNDTIQHIIHYHEPILDNLKILAITEDFIVIDKPAGVACHPTGGYNHFTVVNYLYETIFKTQRSESEIEILKKEKETLAAEISKKFDKAKFRRILLLKKKIKDCFKLGCVNRLDVLTSGILILTFNNKDKYHDLIKFRNIKKKYLAMVEGKFYDEIICDKKIKKMGILSDICEKDGKEAVTKFKRIEYNGEYSLVECIPITGRSHQIRVHLSHLKYPIINDPIYGNSTVEERMYENCDSVGNSKAEEFLIKNCDGKNNRTFRNKGYFICLHAYEYEFLGNKFKTELPKWANIFYK